MRSTGVILFIACLVLLPQQQDATPILLQTMFKYYGLQKLWYSYFGDKMMDDYNMRTFKAYQKCYLGQGSVYYDDVEDDPIFKYNHIPQDENEVKWNITYWNDRNYDFEQPIYNRVKRRVTTRKDGKEPEQFFNKHMKKVLKPIASNITCMMAEIGLIDKNMNVNYDFLINYVSDVKFDYTVLKDQLIRGYKYCETISPYPEDMFLKELLPSYPVKAFSYFKCTMQIELSMIVKKQVFDDYYKYKPFIDEDSTFWGGESPTERGILEFFFSNSI